MVEDIVVDTLTFPITTGQEEVRRDALETIEAIRELKRRHSGVQTTLGISNVSFGLNAAARQVLNSVFLHECVNAGLDTAIVSAAKILPMAKIDDEQRSVALDLVYDRRRPATATSGAYDPLSRFMELFEGVTAAAAKAGRAEELAGLPLFERLERRIVDGERIGLEADLDAALEQRPALEIINDTLLSGMKTVGELFGSGQMQLPFVLQSAEVMKNAVAHLEPHMEKTDSQGKGTIVLATVKGDVHDIGKNLVDIILSNNGYTVVNLGIKQPISTILSAAEEHRADAVGMSGLLVKSTVVMKENLQEMNSRGVAATLPVLLGGAALTRSYVENDLSEVYEGRVDYARDAFEGLRLMDATMARARGAAPTLDAAEEAKRAERKARHERSQRVAARRKAAEAAVAGPLPERSDVALDNPIPTPPFWGTRVVKGLAVAEYAGLVDERALFLGQWGLRGSRAGTGPSYEDLVETQGRPRLRYWLDRLATEGVLSGAAVVYGYFPAVAEGDTLVVLDEPRPDAGERTRFTFPRQRRDRHLCLADFWRPRALAVAAGEVDVLPPAPGHDGPAHRGLRERAVRQGRLPRLPRGARPVRAAHRGAGRVLAPAHPRGAHVPDRRTRRGRGPGGRRGVLQARLPRRPLLLGLRRLPEPRRPDQVRRPAAARAHRRRAVRGAAAAPRAVHGRARRPPPGGQVLQCRLITRADRVPAPFRRRCCGTWTAR